MMKRIGGDRFLKFTVGGVIEGKIKGATEKPNPFHDDTNPNSPKTLIDYQIEINGEEKILSSGSVYLKDNLYTLPKDTPIKIEMKQRGAKKLYTLYVGE